MSVLLSRFNIPFSSGLLHKTHTDTRADIMQSEERVLINATLTTEPD